MEDTTEKMCREAVSNLIREYGPSLVCKSLAEVVQECHGDPKMLDEGWQALEEAADLLNSCFHPEEMVDLGWDPLT